MDLESEEEEECGGTAGAVIDMEGATEEAEFGDRKDLEEGEKEEEEEDGDEGGGGAGKEGASSYLSSSSQDECMGEYREFLREPTLLEGRYVCRIAK